VNLFVGILISIFSYASKARPKRAKIDSFIVNPKSISIAELYGNTDPTTFEWTDGIFSNSVRTFVNNATGPESDVITQHLFLKVIERFFFSS
jgi:hypothetical protein